ncbi:dinP protein [Lactobacillus selangorensis]|uniref:DNA polymerase IV n=1 Tax=Lactobacillus selangorensis TaxID=81857 RepID=A0A0R2FFR2_9LACO|nr:DNA polymerase IV [Lactobacillus selangorensis]KRN27449.1 dinP protein [Lactobacillus selangorensis]KRN31354.1 dinP protein [Lactobacillus selangorensis]
MQDWLEVPLKNDTQRRILHIDMDAFYASIEMRDHPQYRTIPLIIGRDPRETGGKGVVTTANYIARQYGVHSAMPVQKAAELVRANKQAVFKRPNFPHYREISDQIHAIFHTVTDQIETVALDEAYLDISANKLGEKDAIALMFYIQHAITRQTHLVSSAGLSYNKFLAKMGSDYRKPHGRTVILPEQAQNFLARLPIEKFHGVGKKTVPKMNALGVYTGADLLLLSQSQLIREFGKMGYVLYQHARGIDNRPVEYQRTRQSLGKEETYDEPLTTETAVFHRFDRLAAEVADSLRTRQLHGKTVVIKVRNRDFNTFTRRKTLGEPLAAATDLSAIARQIWTENKMTASGGIRLLGITVTGLTPLTFENIRLDL